MGGIVMKKFLAIVCTVLAVNAFSGVQVTKQYCDHNAERAVSNSVRIVNEIIGEHIYTNTEIHLSNFPYKSIAGTTVSISNSTASNVSVQSPSSILNINLDGFDGAMFSSFLLVDSSANAWTMNINHDTNELHVAHLDSDIGTFGSLGSGKYIFTFTTPVTNVLLVTVNKLILY